MAKNDNLDGDILALLTEHEGALRAYARSLLPNWDAVDETLQDAFLVICQKVSQLETREAFLPWAKVIVRFEALKSRRKFARDRLVFSDTLVEMLACEGEAASEVDDTEKWQRALDECLRTLSAPNRELVLAPYRSDGAVVEIARRSGRTVNSLYKLLGRLRHKLRDCMENKLGPNSSKGFAT